jgi:predicted nucleotidyltransferase
MAAAQKTRCAMRTLEDQTVLSEGDKELLVDLKAVIRQFEPTATVLLYGSVARGTNNLESDYDIMVLTEHPPSAERKEEIRGAVFDFELPRHIVFSVLFHSRDDWEHGIVSGSPFRANVEEDAIAI